MAGEYNQYQVIEISEISRFTEKQVEDQAEENGPEHRVDVEGPETHGLGLLGAVSETPCSVRMPAEGQVLQMVRYVFARGGCFAAASHS